MSDEQQNITSSATDHEGVEQPRKRRSRRATAPAMTPEVPTAPESPAPVGEPAPERPSAADGEQVTVADAPAAQRAAEPTAEEPAPEKPKRAPRKRAAKKKVEPTDSDAAAQSPAGDDAPTAATPAVSAIAQDPSAESAPNESAPSESAPTAATEVPVAENQAAPKRKRGGRRAISGGGTPEPAPALDVFAAFGVQREDDANEAPSARAPELDLDVPSRGAATAAEDQADDEAITDEPEAEHEEDSPRLPATALLFQAPDTSRGRRRRRSTDSGTTDGADAGRDDTDSDKTSADTADDERSAEPGAKKKGRGGSRKKRSGQTEPDSARDDGSDDGSAQAGQDDQDGNESGADSGDGDESGSSGGKRRRRRGGRGRRKSGSGSGETQQNQDSPDGPGAPADAADPDDSAGSDNVENGDDGSDDGDGNGSSRRRRRRRSRGSRGGDESASAKDEVTALKGSTRLEAKRQRRREGRDSNRRRSIITEAEFLARRESVDRSMVVRERDGRTQIAVLEDNVLVEHYVARKTQSSMVGNVYLGRVQNVLPSMEAAFVDLGKGRNAVLYAGEVNWDAAGLDGQPRRIEQALSSGDSVLVQVTKDPIGHKGARLTAQITLAGRYLVLVPSGSMTGISRKLPDTERNRLKKLLKEIVPDGQGVIVRTAAEGASEDALRHDVERLTKQWDDIQTKVNRKSTSAPVLLKGEPELSTRVVRDVFNEDFKKLVVAGEDAWKTISEYVAAVAPDLTERLSHWDEPTDVFAEYRIDEQLAKGMDRKVFLPSGGSLVIDRTEAMTVVDVNTGKFTGSGGTLEETVTKNNLEAAEEIVRQLRLRDIGGIIVVDFIDMVLEANRDLVMRRLVECLGRDRTRHQVAEVTSLGLVQMTRKRVGQGLVEAFSETCEHCNGRGFLVHADPVETTDKGSSNGSDNAPEAGRSNRRRKSRPDKPAIPEPEVDPEKQAQVRATLATIAAAAAHAHEHEQQQDDSDSSEASSVGPSAATDAPESDVTPLDTAESVAPHGDPGQPVAPKGGAGEPVTPKGGDAESAGPKGDDAGAGAAQVDAVEPGEAGPATSAAPNVSHAEVILEHVQAAEDKPAP
ncbi:Rne/Rng family ribonuclease [Ruania halotolerans]|uniref:Rne/Rng family ribonuclease n=1 Tax=Ruania halotolerans TaxID=2897773 RepID=UPI001E528663|nr:Rne/Rng family ribonuclease [Ruania halotolerans]UFU07867.1 Rne/Rng family ribonuclease [Ruania halotolerans]